jgi:esterase/lipase
MNTSITHVYFMPGMSANSSIFEYIKLPDSVFKLHFLEWIIPYENESISEYAFRLSKKITHSNSVLIGVSFGGILVQEMTRFLKVSKIIVVSSVLNENDFPYRFKVAKYTKIYKLIPMRMFSDIDKLSKYAFGSIVKNRVDLYKKYLSVNDVRYLNWAVDQVINWKQTQNIENVIHIHGENDKVFPVKNINNNYIKVSNGSHIMIINKYKWFNENLPKLLLA